MKKILAGSSSPMLAKNLAEKLGVEVADVSIKRFPDGECYVKLNEEVEHAIIVQNTYPDENIIELFLLQDAARRMAGRIEVVIPYYGYGRQDKIFEKGEAISAEKMARLIEQDADRIIIVNPHKRHIARFFSKKIEIADATPSIAEYLAGRVEVVIAPDKGAAEMAEMAAKIIGCEHDYFEKRRVDGSVVETKIKKMDVAGRDVAIIDDIISTGGTMVEAIKQLVAQEAGRIYVACIHGLFIGNADDKIIEAGAHEIITTDTIESAYSKVSVAESIANFFRYLSS